MNEMNDFRIKLDALKEQFENGDYDNVQELYDLEEEIARSVDIYDDEDSDAQKLLKEIKRVKREHDFYDEEAELDMLFPNRHDDDFDEDDMSYDSVFGNE